MKIYNKLFNHSHKNTVEPWFLSVIRSKAIGEIQNLQKPRQLFPYESM